MLGKDIRAILQDVAEGYVRHRPVSSLTQTAMKHPDSLGSFTLVVCST